MTSDLSSVASTLSKHANEEASSLAAWENEGGGPLAAARIPAGLDWAAFTARFYPTSRRHEAEPLAAYEAYRKDVASRTRA